MSKKSNSACAGGFVVVAGEPKDPPYASVEELVPPPSPNRTWLVSAVEVVVEVELGGLLTSLGLPGRAASVGSHRNEHRRW